VRIVTCLPAASVVVICRHSKKRHGGQWQVPVPPAEDQRGVDARGKGEVLAADGAVTNPQRRNTCPSSLSDLLCRYVTIGEMVLVAAAS
jgi:hypothetical protein